ncbi:hypothetical protein KR026_005445 [Drosophila bipectinata]|nr:hypothetical protein KR026_005445 [Drosophila bipectinata]
MGRAPHRKKIRARRPIGRVEEQEDYDLLTAEEMSQSMQRWTYDWLRSPDTDSDSEIGAYRRSKFQDLSAYGEWRLPDGKTTWDFRQSAIDLMLKLKSEPYPEIFRPPPLLVAKGATNQLFNPLRYTPNRRLFTEALPLICARVKELMEPPECEGAVGYDQRYYVSSTLVKSLSAHPRPCRYPPEGNLPGENQSWMDGRHCARFFVELQKPLVDYQRLRRLPWRHRPQLRPNKLAIGCRRKVKKPPRTYRPLRPRARIILDEETGEEPQQWLEDEEEPDLYFDHDLDLEPVSAASADYVECEPDLEPNSDATLRSSPRLLRTQSDILLELPKSDVMLRSWLSLESLI